jgi:hypothetical protein
MRDSRTGSRPISGAYSRCTEGSSSGSSEVFFSSTPGCRILQSSDAAWAAASPLAWPAGGRRLLSFS